MNRLTILKVSKGRFIGKLIRVNESGEPQEPEECHIVTKTRKHAVECALLAWDLSSDEAKIKHLS